MKLSFIASLAALSASAAPAGLAERYVPSTHVSAAAHKRDIRVIQIERLQNDKRYVPSSHVSSAPKV